MSLKYCSPFVASRRTLPLTLILAILASLLAVGVARAHVTVNPDEVAPGTNLTFSVRVPTEKEEPTVSVRIEFPATLTVSRFQPKAGWQREVEKDASGRIAAVTWSGGTIAADEYEDFTFAARTPEETGPLVFKAYQTYQGGETVEWVNEEGQDNPAPIAQIQAAPVAGQPEGIGSIEGTAQALASAEAAPAVTVGTAGSETTAATASPAAASDLPLFIALGALVIALLALALATAAFARRRPVVGSG